MLIYYAILPWLALSLLVTLRRERNSDLFMLALVAVGAMAISGLRWNSDIDYGEYAELFEETPRLASFSAESIESLHGEPGYLLISSIFKSMGMEFYVLSLVCAVFAIGAKGILAGRFTRGASLAFCLYLCIQFITIEIIQIRWAVASALIALAFWSQYRRRLGMTVFCFAFATTFHYFSAIFVVVALMVEVRSARLFYAMVVSMSVIGALVAWGWTLGPIAGGLVDSEAYVFKRTVRYLTDPLSHVGVLSYLRLGMVPALYLLAHFRYRSEIVDDGVEFLRKVAFACIAVTLLVSFVPLMHFRAVVLADFFSLLLGVRLLERRMPAFERVTGLVLFVALYAVWYVFDVRNYITADGLYEYKSWLRLVI